MEEILKQIGKQDGKNLKRKLDKKIEERNYNSWKELETNSRKKIKEQVEIFVEKMRKRF